MMLNFPDSRSGNQSSAVARFHLKEIKTPFGPLEVVDVSTSCPDRMFITVFVFQGVCIGLGSEVTDSVTYLCCCSLEDQTSSRQMETFSQSSWWSEHSRHTSSFRLWGGTAGCQFSRSFMSQVELQSESFWSSSPAEHVEKFSWSPAEEHTPAALWDHRQDTTPVSCD